MAGLFGVDIPSMVGSLPTLPEQSQTQPQQPKKGGLFGSGLKWQDVAGIIGDALSAANGRPGIYGQTLAEQRQRDFELKRMQAQRQAGMQDWIAQQQWERANPKPVNNDTVNDFLWYKNLSPEDRALYGQMHPQYITADNGDGTKTVVPVTPGMFGQQQTQNLPPARPVGKLTPLGAQQPTIQNTPAPQLGANGIPAVLTRAQYQATVNALGKEATDAWMQRHGVQLGGM